MQCQHFVYFLNSVKKEYMYVYFSRLDTDKELNIHKSLSFSLSLSLSLSLSPSQWEKNDLARVRASTASSNDNACAYRENSVKLHSRQAKFCEYLL